MVTDVYLKEERERKDFQANRRYVWLFRDDWSRTSVPHKDADEELGKYNITQHTVVYIKQLIKIFRLH